MSHKRKAQLPSTSPPFSHLDRYPATLQGHLKFLEFVTRDVVHAANTKRSQFERAYADETVERTVSGVFWSEAKARLAAISGIPDELRTKLAMILNRELTIDTVERIEELLKPAVTELRDWYEGTVVACSSSEPIKAGEAFARKAATDPDAIRGLSRARELLQGLGRAAELMPSTEWINENVDEFLDIALAKNLELEEAQQELENARQALVQLHKDELAKRGLPPPESPGDWLHLARVAELSDEQIASMTQSDICDHVLAWADRQQFKAKLTPGTAIERDGRDTKHDTHPKKTKKIKNRRAMNADAANCIRRFKSARKKDPTISMTQVVREYVEETGNSTVESIMRVLADHPEQWKRDTNPT